MRLVTMALAFVALVFAVGTSRAAPPASAAGDPAEGARTARRVGCDGCHGEGGRGGGFDETDPKYGRIVAPNLTERRRLYPTRAALDALLRRGRTHDGHVPVGMPIKMFQHLSDREVTDLDAWLRRLPPVRNPKLARSAWSAALKKELADGSFPFLDDMKPDAGVVPPAAPPSEALALGRHLALTTCGECHGWDLNGFGAGEPPPLAVAKAYSAEQFARLMRQGTALTGQDTKNPLMSGVARWRFKVMSDAEIAALKTYLDSR